MAKAKKAPKKEERIEALEARVSELEGDMERILSAVEVQFGEGPFLFSLRDIVHKKQGR